jgi:YD repeat-containing protein
LYVGINDEYPPDNTGAWFVTVNQNAKSLGACPCNSSYQGVLPSSAGDPENPGSGTDGGDAPSGYSPGSGGGSWGSGGGGASARMRTNGNAGGFGPRAVTGDFSVDIATGNLFYEDTDYSTAGQNPLTFTRYYNSRASVSGVPTYGLQLVSATALNGPLGASWRSNYERYLQITSTTVTAERLDGQQLTFTLSGGAWTPDSDIDITLSQAGNTWTLTDSNDTVETYTAMGSSAALLSSIQSRNGYTQTLTYNAAHQLTTVTDSYSRSLTLAYNSHGNLEKLTTPDGTTVTYGYTLPLAGGYNLTSVTYSTTPTSTITYSYTNPNQPGQLWGVTDENGSSYISWTYNYYSRVGTSHIGGSAFATSYSYNSDGTTTITGPNGVADTYTFSMLQGVPKITKISRAATTTTKAATETFAFDANGYLSSSTDWNGSKTAYTNNANGDPLTITEAAGTSVARTTTIAYDSTWIHLPATIATQGLTTSYVYDGNGQVLTRTLEDTTSSTAPYSTSGQTRTWTNTWSNYLLASVKTPNGHTTTLGYDSAGALTSITDALGHVSRITANTAGGLPENIVDPNGVTTTLAYDERQRLTSSQVSGTGGTFTTQYTLAPDGTLSKLTLPDGSYLAYTYFQSHDLWKVADALGNLRPFASAARRTVQWVPVGGFCFKVRRNNMAICWSETERGRPGRS